MPLHEDDILMEDHGDYMSWIAGYWEHKHSPLIVRMLALATVACYNYGHDLRIENPAGPDPYTEPATVSCNRCDLEFEDHPERM